MVAAIQILSPCCIAKQLRLSMEHHVWVSIIALGWGSVNLNQFTQHLLNLGYCSEKGEVRGSLTTVDRF